VKAVKPEFRNCIQPQTGAEPGKFRETDASGGGKSPAKRLNRGGRPFFSFVGEGILPDGYLYELNLWKTKTGDPNFWTAGQTFSPLTARTSLEFSHSLARGCVKTQFSTIPSICSFRQSFPYRKIDRYRFWCQEFSHSLATC
jgi:hypothetical protein